MGDVKVLILKGSPRIDGNTWIMADRIAAGAEEVRAQVESVYLNGLDIQPCDHCDSCKGGHDVGCVVEDDMQDLYPKLRAADAILIASPVYWFNVSAQVKAVIDRIYALAGDEPTDHALSTKRFGVVMAGEDKDPFVAGAVNAFRAFQDMFRYIGAELVGLVFGCALDLGEIRKKPAELEEAFELGKALGSEIKQ